MTDAIIVRGASKHYGDFAALDDIDQPTQQQRGRQPLHDSA
ncbi:hypothetical protein [Mycobacterium sp.]|nr:hypothetical protein [Mycobacterium sp.]HME46641.1 hypothetical protein [Mycobacterium sp.]